MTRPFPLARSAVQRTLPGPGVTLLAALLLGGACNPVFREAGLVTAGEGGVRLQSLGEPARRLVLDQEARPLHNLEGATVSVVGTRLGPWVWVRDWRVESAADGSEPFVGVLRQHGSNLVLDDQNSGMAILIDPVSIPSLTPWVGHLVLVVGFVTGAQQVRAVGFRVLDE